MREPYRLSIITVTGSISDSTLTKQIIKRPCSWNVYEFKYCSTFTFYTVKKTFFVYMLLDYPASVKLKSFAKIYNFHSERNSVIYYIYKLANRLQRNENDFSLSNHQNLIVKGVHVPTELYSDMRLCLCY